MLKPPPVDCQARGTLFQGLDFASAQYGSAEQRMSSSTVQQIWHEAANSYAQQMERKTFGFGARLKAAREKAGMSGTTLGKGAGENGKDASKASVSDWEKERHYPKADQLRVICLKLNINVDDLIFGDIKEEMKLIQAESAIRALTPGQRQSLVDRMAYSARSGETLSRVSNGLRETVSSSEGVNFLDEKVAKETNDGASHTPQKRGQQGEPSGKAS